VSSLRVTVVILASAWAGLGAGPVRAQTQELPALTAPVNDLAHVIDAASAAELDRLIRVLQAATGDVVVVATVDTFAPYATIEEYAVKLFEKAGIGAAEQDNGALVLLAVRDRRVRIEVGYGLEEFITDGFAGDTIRTQMLPRFREERFGAGLVAGTTRVVTRIAERRGVTLDNVALPEPARAERGSGLSPGAILLIFLLFAVMSRLMGSRGSRVVGRRGRRSTWSGWSGGIGGFGGGFGGGGFGGGGGGFGGFGGGGSGGGGASGGW
jgi:uncharacterized protein